MSPGGDDACDDVVLRLVRAHNAAVFMVFAAALGSVMYVQATHAFAVPPRWIWISRTLLVVLPMLALVGTAMYTSRLMRSLGPAPDVSALAEAFARSKRRSLAALTCCGLAAAASLIVGHTMIDVALAAASFVLLIAMRPSAAGLAVFANIAVSDEGTRRDRDPPPD